MKSIKIIRKLVYVFVLLSFSSIGHAESLSKIVNLTLQNSANFKSKVETYNANYAYKGMATSYLKPTIDLSGNYNFAHVNDNSDVNADPTVKTNSNVGDISITLTQPLFSYEAIQNYKRADLYVDAARTALEIERNNIIVSVVEAYFTVLETQDGIDSIAVQKKYLQALYDKTETEVKVGTSRNIDLQKIYAQLESIKAQEIVNSNTLESSKAIVDSLVGVHVISYPKIKDTIQNISIPKLSLDELKDSVLRSNLDLLSANLAVKSADYDLSLTKVGYYPTVALVASHGYTDTNVHAYPSQSSLKAQSSIGVSLSMNLYSGGLDSKKVAQEKHTRNSKLYEAKALEGSIISNLTKCYLTVYNGLSQITALEASVKSDLNYLDLAIKSKNVGLNTNNDVLEVTQTYAGDVNSLNSARYNVFMSIVSLKALLGNLKIKDIQELDYYFN